MFEDCSVKKMMMQEKAVSLIRDAESEPAGYVKIFETDGVYLHTRASIMDSQKEWEEEDSCKKFDFSCYPYWLEANGVKDMVGYLDAADLLNNFLMGRELADFFDEEENKFFLSECGEISYLDTLDKLTQAQELATGEETRHETIIVVISIDESVEDIWTVAEAFDNGLVERQAIETDYISETDASRVWVTGFKFSDL